MTGSTKICILQGHPHAEPSHLCHALADAYEKGATEAGLDVERLTLATMDIPFLHDPRDFGAPPPEQILDAQEKIKSADHLATFYPLWMGTMPALVKAFFEQMSRNNFAISQSESGGWPRKMLAGKSARVVVTMGMPSAAYRVFFGAHGVRAFETGILAMSGFKPIKDTLIGAVDVLSPKQIDRLLARMRSLGARAE